MADFDIPGIGNARKGLKDLAFKSSARGTGARLGGLQKRIVEELYAEIREARLAGATWKDISKAIQTATNVKFREETTSTIFAEIDKRYERETGVAALPVWRKKKKTA